MGTVTMYINDYLDRSSHMYQIMKLCRTKGDIHAYIKEHNISSKDCHEIITKFTETFGRLSLSNKTTSYTTHSYEILADNIDIELDVSYYVLRDLRYQFKFRLDTLDNILTSRERFINSSICVANRNNYCISHMYHDLSDERRRIIQAMYNQRKSIYKKLIKRYLTMLLCTDVSRLIMSYLYTKY